VTGRRSTIEAILSVMLAKVCPGAITGAFCSPISTSVGLAIKIELSAISFQP
jgi:hypothetical protein